MKNIKILALLLIVVFAFSLSLGVSAAPNDPTIAVELNSSTATQVTFDIIIKNNPGFDVMTAYLHYDANVLEFVSNSDAAKGSVLPANKGWSTNAVGKGENAYVNITVSSMTEMMSGNYITVIGNGKLLTLTFNVKAGADGKSTNLWMEAPAHFFYKVIDPIKMKTLEYPLLVEQTKAAPLTIKAGSAVITPTCEHKNTTDVFIKNPTCTEGGIKTVFCMDCGKPVSENVLVSPVPHTPVIVPGFSATCTEPGISDGSKCSVCGTTLVEQTLIPASGKHTEEVIPGYPATCGKGGLSDGKKCTVCGKITVEQVATQPTGAHSRVVIPGKPATCGEAGLTDGEKCSVCGLITKEQTSIEPTGQHTEARIPAEPATCLKPGMSAGSHCSVCGKIIVAPHEIPKADHTPVIIPGKAASCGVAGLTDGEKCSSCGEIIKAQTEIPAISDHDYVEESRVEADCLTNGTITEKCSICGDKKTTVLPTPGHTSVVIEGKEATCTEPGLSDGEKCSVCGAIIVAQKEVPVVPHTFGEWIVTKEATCKETGLKVRSCVCGESESDVIPVVEHVIVADAAVAATCTKTGLTAGEHCSVCNEVIVAQKEVAKLEHDFKKDSENEDGTIYKCSACGETSFVPHEENPPTTDNVVYAIVALVLMSASALVIFNGKKWTIG